MQNGVTRSDYSCKLEDAPGLLDDYMSVMRRQAFDLDYMTGGADDAPMESVLHAGLGI